MLDKAIAFAVDAHSGQLRKGTNTPYIVHPMEAASIVSTMTDDREVIAAAVLHDTLEDCEGISYEQLQEAFGKRVADLVKAESEQKEEDAVGSWRKRKETTLSHLQDCPSDVKMIALADKLSNMRAIARDYRAIGDQLWERFNQKDKAEQGWYYSSLVKCFGDLAQHSAYLEYCKLVATVFHEGPVFALDPSIIVDAGLAYETGETVEQDYEKAMTLYQQAAEAGNWMAYNNMGWLYQNGFGYEKDIPTAIHCYELAAEHGNDMAMVNLGNLYEFGEGVEKDYVKAFQWYNKAAEAGNLAGRFNVANFYHHGYGVARDRKLAFEMFSDLYDEGTEGTAFYMGLYYEKGIIVEQDYDKAMEYYLEGAEEEDMYCYNQLGVMYGRGLGVEQDIEEAKKWYRLAAIAGNTLAKINLAALDNGEDVVEEPDGEI